MTKRTMWRTAVQVADFCIDGKEIQAVITDEKDFIVASITIAVVYDDDEREALYWALRKALEGDVSRFLITNDKESDETTKITRNYRTIFDALENTFGRNKDKGEVRDDD